MVESINSYYDVLKVSRSATKSEIKDGYKKLMLLYHPDKSPNCENAKILKIIEAFSILNDDQKRKEYNASLKMAENKNLKNLRFSQNLENSERMKFEQICRFFIFRILKRKFLDVVTK
ncbi:DnaJ-related protein scj1 [Bonamia ostreae]|uniref:DnaJ-related protein scj1 n=1 Tax=Bonamia ostreae TaxID=126728 RepID=A0ABV2AF07_9EUKA